MLKIIFHHFLSQFVIKYQKFRFINVKFIYDT